MYIILSSRPFQLQHHSVVLPPTSPPSLCPRRKFHWYPSHSTRPPLTLPILLGFGQAQRGDLTQRRQSLEQPLSAVDASRLLSVRPAGVTGHEGPPAHQEVVVSDPALGGDREKRRQGLGQPLQTGSPRVSGQKTPTRVPARLYRSSEHGRVSLYVVSLQPPAALARCRRPTLVVRPWRETQRRRTRHGIVSLVRPVVSPQAPEPRPELQCLT